MCYLLLLGVCLPRLPVVSVVRFVVCEFSVSVLRDVIVCVVAVVSVVLRA